MVVVCFACVCPTYFVIVCSGQPLLLSAWVSCSFVSVVSALEMYSLSGASVGGMG